MNMNEKAETLVSVIDRLSTLLTTENQNLEARDFSDAGPLVEEKDRLCRAFDLLVRGLAKDKDSISETEPALRQRLRDMGTQMKELVESNSASLKQAITANERLMSAVREAAIQCTPKTGNYTQFGSLTAGARIDSKAPSPVTTNQIL